MAYEGPGTYRHYKGGLYRVYGLATPEWLKPIDGPIDRAYDVVVYEPATPGGLLDAEPDVTFWLRPRRDFDATVEIPDSTPTRRVPRFVMTEGGLT